MRSVVLPQRCGKIEQNSLSATLKSPDGGAFTESSSFSVEENIFDTSLIATALSAEFPHQGSVALHDRADVR